MPFTPFSSSLISASSLSEKILAVVCIKRSSSLTSTVSLALLARESSWSICSLAPWACAVMAAPPNSSSKTDASLNEVWKSVFIILSSYLVLISNWVRRRQTLRSPLGDVELDADQTECDQHLLFFREFCRS